MARTSGSRAETTAPRVRQAALRLFAQHGYAAVSMRQIASEVGVQAGALYNYTPDKQSLLLTLMRAHMDELLAELAKLPMGTPFERLDNFTRFHIQFHLPRQDEIFIAYMELRNLTPENFRQVETMRKTYENALIDILDAGQTSGDFAAFDSKVTALALIAMLNGLTTWYSPGGRLTLDQIEAQYIGMVRGIVTSKSVREPQATADASA